ncbi:hypothetical protein EA462_00960 [Natrarchaeobius halalkaliphilus]|uniref:Uncharacterized protein n=1 Tax=Natrarchaeobius halalkaliphilus TaxID=1679091 RepID=A0A3N6LSD4_9EURY|nr:hypothetical protein [Natrarchaeobius halalkaliphilus]RQG92828.1 hypothetical protein EA462_00960 [Natrarchaeobius halalkaliphilus]
MVFDANVFNRACRGTTERRGIFRGDANIGEGPLNEEAHALDVLCPDRVVEALADASTNRSRATCFCDRERRTVVPGPLPE